LSRQFSTQDARESNGSKYETKSGKLAAQQAEKG
jgi:hypothetical protein